MRARILYERLVKQFPNSARYWRLYIEQEVLDTFRWYFHIWYMQVLYYKYILFTLFELLVGVAFINFNPLCLAWVCILNGTCIIQIKAVNIVNKKQDWQKMKT